MKTKVHFSDFRLVSGDRFNLKVRIIFCVGAIIEIINTLKHFRVQKEIEKKSLDFIHARYLELLANEIEIRLEYQECPTSLGEILDLLNPVFNLKNSQFIKVTSFRFSPTFTDSKNIGKKIERVKTGEVRI